MRRDIHDKTVEALRKKRLMPCPSCGQMPRSLVGLGKITMLEHFDSDAPRGAGKVVPIILVGCNDCGFVWTYSAIHLGVIDPDPVATPPAGASDHEPR